MEELKANAENLESMKLVFGFLLGFVVFGTVLNGSAADDYVDAVELAQAGNAWKQGESIPIKLLQYRSSHEDGCCFLNPQVSQLKNPNGSLLTTRIHLHFFEMSLIRK